VRRFIAAVFFSEVLEWIVPGMSMFRFALEKPQSD